MAAIAALQSLYVFQPQFILKFYSPLESTTRYFGTAEEFMSKSFESEKICWNSNFDWEPSSTFEKSIQTP